MEQCVCVCDYICTVFMLMIGHLIQLYVIESYYSSRDVLTEMALMLKTTVSSSLLGFFPLSLLHIYIK